jgi:hypothetical protein
MRNRNGHGIQMHYSTKQTGKSKHFRVFERKQSKGYGQVNRQILVMVLFLSILALTYEVPKLNTPKYITLQRIVDTKLDIYVFISYF